MAAITRIISAIHPGEWRQFVPLRRRHKRRLFGRDHALYLLSRKEAPRGKVLRFGLDSPFLASATLVVPEGRGVVEGFAPCDHGIYVSYLVGGPSELFFFHQGSTKGRELPILPVSSVTDLDSWHGDELVYGDVSFLTPFAWFKLDTPDTKPRRTALYMTLPADFSDIEVCGNSPRPKTARKFLSISCAKRAEAGWAESDNPLRLRRLRD